MVARPLPLAFEQFKRDQTAAFERIARRTRGTHDADDLRSEAWLIAIEIGTRRGCPLDLFNRADQQQVLSWLYKRFVDFVDGKFKESLDQGQDAESAWYDRLAAPEETNPLAQLMRLDDEEASAIPLANGYSQYCAYLVLLNRCEMSAIKLADYLSVSFMTLRRRIERAREHAERQPSLFDHVESVDVGFVPRATWMRKLWNNWRARAAQLKDWLSSTKNHELLGRAHDRRQLVAVQMPLI